MSQSKPTIVQRLIGKLPDEIKRLLFGVVVFQLCTNGQADIEKLSELNREMKLASSVSALEFPALWYGKVNFFDDKERERLIQLVNAPIADRDVARSLAAGVPEWLKYASVDKIAVDIERLVSQAHRVA